MSFAAIGGLLALRRPGNAEGWLLLAVATAWSVPMTAVAVGQSLLDHHAGGSAAAWLAWPAVWLWLPPLGLMGTQVLLRFPDGTLPTPRWRWFSRLTLALIAAAAAGMAVVAPADTDGYANLTYLPWVPQQLAGGVALATGVLPFSGQAGTAASVLAAMALFAPLRRRVQRAVDRRFNRARYDAEAVTTAFSRRMREPADLDAVRADLAAAVTRILDPAHEDYRALLACSPGGGGYQASLHHGDSIGSARRLHMPVVD